MTTEDQEFEKPVSNKKIKKVPKFKDEDNRTYSQDSTTECVFSIEEIEDDKIVIRDQMRDFHSKPIRSSTQQVITKLTKVLKDSNRKLFFYDSEGKKAEILFDKDLKFTGFK